MFHRIFQFVYTQSDCRVGALVNVTAFIFVMYVAVMCRLSFPDAFDTEQMKRTFMDIVEGKVVQIPVYDFKTSSRYSSRTPAQCI